MAVQVPHRTEVKLIAAIVEKHPKVRFAASRTSAYADLYDRMEQAPRFLSTPVQTSWVWRSRDSSGGGASCPKTNAKDERFLPLNWQEALVFS